VSGVIGRIRRWYGAHPLHLLALLAAFALAGYAAGAVVAAGQWQLVALWFLVAIFIGLVLRGRRFGPVIQRPLEVARADAEWAVAVGELLRRSGARALTLGLLANASERAVAARTGLPAQPRERFWNALYARAPELAGELDQAERALYSSAGGDAELLSAAQRLHNIAYPPARERRRQPTTEETR